MKKTLGILAIVAILMIVTATIVGARGGTTAPVDRTQLVDETPTNWFVQFSSKPLVQGTSAKTLASEKSKFESAAASLGLDYTERYAFSSLWNGVSISMPATELSKLTSISGVTAVYPVLKIPMPEVTFGDAPNLFTSVSMIGADVAQNEMGLTGEGVRVAVMDTGVDYQNPDLGGCFGFFCRVFKGYDFVGDAYDAELNPVPVPDNDPDDCYGHGTHVAGIIGANGEVVGVAPGVRFGAYRVFGCEGSTDSDIMLAAMEMALADGMDVLNMSIGSAFTWPQYPTAVASNALVDAGMVVVASAGNEGDYELYGTGAPALGEKVLSVASVDNTEMVLPIADVEGIEPNALHQVPFVPMTYSGPIPTSGTEDIVYVGQGCDADLPLLADPTGKIALIVRGTCSFNEKASNAIDAGATGVVVFNNQPGTLNGTLGSVIDGVTPVVGISQTDGTWIMSLTDATWTWTTDLESFPIATAGLISSFSSYGPSPDLDLKPDISAPGGSIYSTLPLEQGGHGTMSGTSMASPHIAGAAALLLDYKPTLTPADIRDRLLNSAQPQLWSLGPGYGLLDHVYRQGAGLAYVPSAATAKTIITPSKISVGESSAGPQTVTLTIQNQTRHIQTFTLDWISAIAAQGVLAIDDFWTTDEVLTFSPNPLMVPAMGSATVDVTFTPPTQDDTGVAGVPFSTLYNGYITLSPDVAKPDEANADQQHYSVPYFGFVGDYQDIFHLDNVYGLPALVDKDWNDVLEGHVFTMRQGDLPHILVHLEHQATILSVEVLNSVTGRRARPIFSEVIHEDWMERNAWYNYIFDFSWDGNRIVRDRLMVMPDGNYQLQLKVLKALGDPDNPADWETWTSPMFVIQRKN